jgi:S-formylglutathione hydrolase FrmB
MPQPRRRDGFPPASRVALLVLLTALPAAHGFGRHRADGAVPNLEWLNAKLSGKIHDYTANHGADRRMYSAALDQRRDVYVYVPPGYDPAKRYPLVVWLHGQAQDEKTFLDLVDEFDRGMSNGSLPKCVIVAPDGTTDGRAAEGRAALRAPVTLYLNSPLGRYEDYIVYDVWNLATTGYSIRPERGAHVLAGASMGGFGAYNLGIKHKKDFGVLVSVLAPINLRYADCHGRYHTNFNPDCFGTATEYRPNEVVARFGPLGIVKVRQRDLLGWAFGDGPEVVAKIAAENPAEMIFQHDVKPGDFEMFAGYGQCDEFNFDAQAESFAALARGKGLAVHTVLVPGGKHNRETGLALLPEFTAWIRPRLEPFAPKD